MSAIKRPSRKRRHWDAAYGSKNETAVGRFQNFPERHITPSGTVQNFTYALFERQPDR
jgi:hypothetical protein